MNREPLLRIATPVDVIPMPTAAFLSPGEPEEQNFLYQGTGGVSTANCGPGFQAAFLDQSTGFSYLSRFADGRAAPLHVLGGLPDELGTDWDIDGHVRAVKDSVIAGFLLDKLFYTREQAASAGAQIFKPMYYL